MALEAAWVTVTDVVLIHSDLDTVYQFLWDARRWPEVNAHVRSVEVCDESAVRQRLRMQLEADGRSVTTESIRDGEPPHRIRYWQVHPPPFLREHTGVWECADEGTGVRVSLTHAAVLEQQIAPEYLGVPTVDEARARVAEMLSRNGRRTIEGIKRLVEGLDDEGPRTES
jgi:aromatase